MSISEATSVAIRLDPATAKPHWSATSLRVSAEDVTDGIAALETTYCQHDSAGVCVADGFGVKVTVDRGALVVEDGIAEHRRKRRYDKATHGLRRVVVTNPYGGSLSWDGLRWCQKLGIGLTVVGADGTAYFTNTPRLNDDPRLRRTQALAANQEVGLRISRLLLAAKVDGQALNVSKRLRDLDTAVALGRLAQAIEVAETVEQVRQAEAAAANLYWRAWCARPEVTLRFAAKDRGRVPDHWSQFEGRRSLLTGATNNRKAERPINAILNYAYALLECEAVRACHVVGLDPGLAVVHMDREGRQSMALDLMEPVRPAVEEFVLKLVASRQFRKADFVELADGTCRLKAPLTHELCESLPLWGRKVAPYAEKVSHLLGEALTGKYTARTPLTRARNIAAQELLKETKHERKARQAGLDPALFQERILPKLTGIRLALLSEVTGISIGHCSEMRRGQYVPNVSTWPALAELVGVDIVAPGLPADA